MHYDEPMRKGVMVEEAYESLKTLKLSEDSVVEQSKSELVPEGI